ncbi:DsrE family protein [Clostridium chauvoei]|uniref:Uncharacterized protein n=2 Tax=Clostridium chauvoei TaxID=46867 RepID=S6EXS9_9CLOT|nr:DsrE family protein [Clostridium chauvoei]ATD54434.1 hypothetical protein BTM20_03970 [Clostridium chauvoei]ATD57882.1 hypothetical protein BTM21_09090 [Clostridium chauvoei]MBX7279670.1 DsrE family protein [Clostridium chauvoei]MBX7282039.1 DsrE family protein [Clostridium chauvoei]MBX7284561.1 DsrE family protein [Clostridium chauvoei]
MKVLYHIDNPSKWKLTVENVKNMVKYGKESGKTFEIGILVNSVAVIDLKEQIAVNSKMYIKFDELAKENVKFMACHNALKKLTITKEELCSFVEIVPCGVATIAEKHEEGYCYIKA